MPKQNQLLRRTGILGKSNTTELDHFEELAEVRFVPVASAQLHAQDAYQDFNGISFKFRFFMKSI